MYVQVQRAQHANPAFALTPASAVTLKYANQGDLKSLVGTVVRNPITAGQPATRFTAESKMGDVLAQSPDRGAALLNFVEQLSAEEQVQVRTALAKFGTRGKQPRDPGEKE